VRKVTKLGMALEAPRRELKLWIRNYDRSPLTPGPSPPSEGEEAWRGRGDRLIGWLGRLRCAPEPVLPGERGNGELSGWTRAVRAFRPLLLFVSGKKTGFLAFVSERRPDFWLFGKQNRRVGHQPSQIAGGIRLLAEIEFGCHRWVQVEMKVVGGC